MDKFAKSLYEEVKDKKVKNVIEIKEEVRIGNVILEKGDQIRIITESGIDFSRVDNSSSIQVPKDEMKRLISLGVEVPLFPKQGPITFKGKKIGYADNFNGESLTDKDFVKKYVKEVLWYVN